VYSPTADDRKCLLSFSAFARRCRVEISVEITALQRTSTSVTVPSVLPNDAIQAVKTEIEPITVLQFSLAHTSTTGYYTYSAGGLGQLKFGYAGYNTPSEGELYFPGSEILLPRCSTNPLSRVANLRYLGNLVMLFFMVRGTIYL
jgi:hypothetical protein